MNIIFGNLGQTYRTAVPAFTHGDVTRLIFFLLRSLKRNFPLQIHQSIQHFC